MGSTAIKIKDDVLNELEKEEGNSWTKKINALLKQKIKPTDPVEVDYDKIKNIVESALMELQKGRL